MAEGMAYAGGLTRVVLDDTVNTISYPAADGGLRDPDILAVVCEGQSVRYVVTDATLDQDPTADFGMPITAGSPAQIPYVSGQEIRFLRMAEGAIIQYQWFRKTRAA